MEEKEEQKEREIVVVHSSFFSRSSVIFSVFVLFLLTFCIRAFVYLHVVISEDFACIFFLLAQLPSSVAMMLSLLIVVLSFIDEHFRPTILPCPCLYLCVCHEPYYCHYYNNHHFGGKRKRANKKSRHKNDNILAMVHIVI